MKGYNDDLIMALAIGCWVRDTAIQTNARDLNYQKAFVDSIITTNTTFNTRVKGQQGYKDDSGLQFLEKAGGIIEQIEEVN